MVKVFLPSSRKRGEGIARARRPEKEMRSKEVTKSDVRKERKSEVGQAGRTSAAVLAV